MTTCVICAARCDDLDFETIDFTRQRPELTTDHGYEAILQRPLLRSFINAVCYRINRSPASRRIIIACCSMGFPTTNELGRPSDDRRGHWQRWSFTASNTASHMPTSSNACRDRGESLLALVLRRCGSFVRLNMASKTRKFADPSLDRHRPSPSLGAQIDL